MILNVQLSLSQQLEIKFLNYKTIPMHYANIRHMVTYQVLLEISTKTSKK